MSKLPHSLVGSPGSDQTVVVFVNGEVYSASTHPDRPHPNWDAILDAVNDGDDSDIVALFEVGKAVAEKFNSIREDLSDRIRYADGVLYFDNDPIHDALASQAVAMLEDGEDGWEALIYFYENVQNNPNEHSKQQLYTWITGLEQTDDRKLTINEFGMILGYKAVQSIGDELFESLTSGRALVNGKEQNGRIKQGIGDVVEMPRSEVTHDPETHCHYGLHVGTWGYASTFGGDTVLEVWVNPRDVVSVPNDHNAAKMRTCRYEVVDTLDAPYNTSYSSSYINRVFGDDEGWGETDDYDYCGECDEYRKDCICDTNDPFANAPHSILGGDQFRSRDARRTNTFTVNSVSNGFAHGSWSNGAKRSISVDRLLSYRYERV